ncbi:MAG: hypothetical protein ACT4P8_19710 [Betaproteobacteria bacterium]
MKDRKHHREDATRKLVRVNDMDEMDCFMLEDEDPPCSEYLVMTEQCNMPALQEYLHEFASTRGLMSSSSP